MPCRPLRTSFVAASCGSLLSRNLAAIPNIAGSNVMVTDSIAFCANPKKLGITSLGLGAPHASAGASSAKNNGNVYFLMEKVLGCSSAGFIGQRCGLALDRFVREV